MSSLKKKFIDMAAPILLNALRAFEASARHKSFSKAANELNVSAAAVGQLVRSLESYVGKPLLIRSNTGAQRLQPTDVAELALADLQSGFERLSRGLATLQAGADHEVLTVTLSPALAAKWLLPRLESFQAAWPDLDVHLDTSLKPVDFAVQRVDVGLRYGHGQWSGLVAEKLLDEQVFPVCAPAMAHGLAVQTPADLQQLPLIHDVSMDSDSGFPSWQAWFAHAGVTETTPTPALRINNSAAVLQAAMAGQGVALARSQLVKEDLQSGRLVRLFPDLSVPSNLAYYVVYRPECASLPRLQAFLVWLRLQTEPDRMAL